MEEAEKAVLLVLPKHSNRMRDSDLVGLVRRRYREHPHDVYRAIRQLRSAGLVERETKKGMKFVSVTQSGMTVRARLMLEGRRAAG